MEEQEVPPLPRLESQRTWWVPISPSPWPLAQYYAAIRKWGSESYLPRILLERLAFSVRI
jgi:hypothetical protein